MGLDHRRGDSNRTSTRKGSYSVNAGWIDREDSTLQTERNVLIIVQNLPVPFDRRVWQEAVSLRRAGFGVTVICPKKKIYTKSYEQLEGVDIYRYSMVLDADRTSIGFFV